MNENIDLTKILKGCPTGFELYSSIHGKVIFHEIDEYDWDYPIYCKDYKGDYITFSKKGYLLTKYSDVECVLVPSKEQKDWSKFTAPWYKKEELVKPKFKVGDKIVDVFMKYMDTPGSQFIISEITEDKYIFTDSSYISISSQNSWELVPDKKPKFDPKTLQQYDKVLVRDSIDDTWGCSLFSHINKHESFPYRCVGNAFVYCIPYNEETKHLVGKSDEAPEYYRYWED